MARKKDREDVKKKHYLLKKVFLHMLQFKATPRYEQEEDIPQDLKEDGIK